MIDTLGADRVVLGIDWPVDMRIDWPVAWVLGLQSLTQKEKEPGSLAPHGCAPRWQLRARTECRTISFIRLGGQEGAR